MTLFSIIYHFLADPPAVPITPPPPSGDPLEISVYTDILKRESPLSVTGRPSGIGRCCCNYETGDEKVPIPDRKVRHQIPIPDPSSGVVRESPNPYPGPLRCSGTPIEKVPKPEFPSGIAL